MPLKWKPRDPNDVIEKYRSGVSLLQLEGQLGVSRNAIRAFLVRNGVEIRGRKTVQPADPDIINRYLAGESVLSISKDIGRTRATVTAALKAAGINLRGIEFNGRNDFTARARAALARETLRSCIGGHEDNLRELLESRIQVHPQRAVGPYNIDLAILPVAVEVLGSDWHRSSSKVSASKKRIEYLFDCGWNVFCVWIPARSSLCESVADQIVAFVEESRANPAFIRQYRMIGGNGQIPSAASLYADYLP